MNGACKGAFVLIQKECPSVQYFVCPAHGMDGFLKNVGSSAESIRMQVNVMGISRISVNVMVILDFLQTEVIRSIQDDLPGH
jgi:hypothetical protein